MARKKKQKKVRGPNLFGIRPLKFRQGPNRYGLFKRKPRKPQRISTRTYRNVDPKAASKRLKKLQEEERKAEEKRLKRMWR